jgi:LPS-assembly lipoprotein
MSLSEGKAGTGPMRGFLVPVMRAGALAALLPLLAACLYRPLYGETGLHSAVDLSQVEVAPVDTRVGQQVRNHLVFLFDGGRGEAARAYTLNLRVTSVNSQFAAVRNVRDATAGTVTVTVGYELVNPAKGERVAAGSRVASASYDRTQQSFANERAVIDAENRAAREAAEQLRLAVAADLGRR